MRKFRNIFREYQIFEDFFLTLHTKMEINEEKKVLLGLSSDELKAIVRDLGMPAFTAGQILKWLYQQHVTSIDEMTNLSKANRERLKEQYVVGAMAPIDCQRSKDGTVKYLFPVRRSEYSENSDYSEKFVETVFIPDGERATLCVSCQVGCKMNCLFCQTGKQGFEGNLTAADILNQIYALPERERLTNIVFMGQGEPMDNLDAVLRATEILTADYGYAWSPRRQNSSVSSTRASATWPSRCTLPCQNSAASLCLPRDRCPSLRLLPSCDSMISATSADVPSSTSALADSTTRLSMAVRLSDCCRDWTAV